MKTFFSFFFFKKRKKNQSTFSNILFPKKLLIELDVFQQTVFREGFMGSFRFAQQQTRGKNRTIEENRYKTELCNNL